MNTEPPKPRVPMGPVAGLWVAAIGGLVGMVAGLSDSAGPAVGAVAAICFTLAAGFLAVAEAVGRRPSP